MSNSAIRLVVFDLGRVMIRITAVWKEACRYAGVEYRPFPETVDIRSGFAQLEDALECDRMDFISFTRAMTTLTLDLYTPDEVAAAYMGIIQEEYPGMLETVEALHAAGLATACLSNTCRPHWAEFMKPERYPAICRLHYPHASHLFGVRKPGQEIYRKFETATGFQPSEILFFDDKQENIEGAAVCGWHAVRITPELGSIEQIRTACREFGLLEN